MDILLYILFAILILCGIYCFLEIHGKIYWMRKGMRVLNPAVYKKYKKLGVLQYTAKLYNLCKYNGLRHMGGYEFFTPIYEPVDLDIIRSIMYKDFAYFTDRPFYHNRIVDPLTANLFQLNGEEWATARKKLVPAFTTGKMKMMFQNIVHCTESLLDVLNRYAETARPVNARELLSRFIIDVIGSCAFGIECNCLKDPDAEFWKQCSRVFVPPKRLRIVLNMSRILPKWFMTLFKIRTTEKEIDEFFIKVVKETIQFRERNNISRKDFMQMMIEMKNEDNKNSCKNCTELDDNTLYQITAHCYMFLTAGYETSAINLTFALYEMALNQDIQQKLREEINATLKIFNGKITYESVMGITYLDKVVQETLRKHPPGQTLFRCCTKRYQVAGTDTYLEPGTIVLISVYGIHRDPQYYPQPEKFMPERFNEDIKAKRPSVAYQPFGGGFRKCIASRFGSMQTKIGLVTILRNFKVTVNQKTPEPLKYKPECLLVCGIDGDIWLNIEKI